MFVSPTASRVVPGLQAGGEFNALVVPLAGVAPDDIALLIEGDINQGGWTILDHPIERDSEVSHAIHQNEMGWSNGFLDEMMGRGISDVISSKLNPERHHFPLGL
jgi:hypothetical protein